MSNPASAPTRLRRAWKDAWLSFRALTWTELGEPGWCWLSRALQMYGEEQPDVIRALQAEFEDLSWWEQWTEWNERYEQLLPSATDLRTASSSPILPSELPMPPDEPDGLWTQAEELWRSEDRLLAIGGGTIRTVLARGRATRTVRGT